MKCPECKGCRRIYNMGEAWECYLCRSTGVVTPETSRAWHLEQDAERIRVLRASLARDAHESRLWKQLSFAWVEAAPMPPREKCQKASCQNHTALPLTDDRQHRLAFYDESQTDGGQQPSADAVVLCD